MVPPTPINRERRPQSVAETGTTKVDPLPEIQILDGSPGWKQRDEVLSSFVQEYFSGNAGTISILEAGCGRHWGLDLGPISYRLTGVDIDEHALELRVSHEGDMDRAVLGDLRDVKLEEHSFDLVYCADVIEHIDGAERVIANLFTWLKTKGLLILIFPDRDSVWAFITRVTPLWAHVLFYRYVRRSPNAGKPGFGPFPTCYDRIVSRRGIHEYCRAHGHRILREYGRPYEFKKLGWLSPAGTILFKLLHYASIGKLSAAHGGLIYVIQKG
jgi:SAM-dependent methyltransferase